MSAGVAQRSSFTQYLTGGAFPKSTLARPRIPRIRRGGGDPAPLTGRPGSLLAGGAEAEGVGHDGDDALEAEGLAEHRIHPGFA